MNKSKEYLPVGRYIVIEDNGNGPDVRYHNNLRNSIAVSDGRDVKFYNKTELIWHCNGIYAKKWFIFNAIKQGRPTKYGHVMRKYYQRMPDDIIEFLRKLGPDEVIRRIRKWMIGNSIYIL